MGGRSSLRNAFRNIYVAIGCKKFAMSFRAQFRPAAVVRRRPMATVGAVALCLAFAVLPFYLSHRHRVRCCRRRRPRPCVFCVRRGGGVTPLVT